MSSRTVRMADIGEEQREWELLPLTEPAEEPTYVPAEQPAVEPVVVPA